MAAVPVPTDDWQCAGCKLRIQAKVHHRKWDDRPRCLAWQEEWIRLDNGDYAVVAVVVDQGR